MEVKKKRSALEMQCFQGLRVSESTPFFIKGCILLYGTEPAFPNLLQRPGGCPEEMQHGIVTARMERKVTDYGGDPKLIGAEHKPYSYDDKPAESGFAGKTGFKVA